MKRVFAALLLLAGCKDFSAAYRDCVDAGRCEGQMSTGGGTATGGGAATGGGGAATGGGGAATGGGGTATGGGGAATGGGGTATGGGGAATGGGGAATGGGGPPIDAGVCPAESIVSHANHSCARLADGGYMCWGHNQAGQLGNDSRDDGGASSLAVPFSHNYPFSSVVVGLDFTCAIWAGDVYCFGDLDGGPAVPLGSSVTGGAVISGASEVVNSSRASCAVIDGGVQCWGKYNSTGATVPAVPNFGQPVLQITGGDDHFCAIRQDRSVACFGYSNQLGQLGNDGGSAIGVQSVLGLSQVVQVAAGSNHTCALEDGGAVWCWGDNTYGQSSTNGNGKDLYPRRVALDAGVVSLGLGTDHSCAVDVGGRVWCWGINDHGQTTINNTGMPVSPPQQASFGPGVVQLAGGSKLTCALYGDGGIDCAGTPSFDETGSGATGDSITPARLLCP
ncbi:MAG: hypothetical protein QM723_40800 [Myxococcaceae bacterium]